MRLELFTTEQLHINSDKGTFDSLTGTAINSVRLMRVEKEMCLFRLLPATTDYSYHRHSTTLLVLVSSTKYQFNLSTAKFTFAVSTYYNFISSVVDQLIRQLEVVQPDLPDILLLLLTVVLPQFCHNLWTTSQSIFCTAGITKQTNFTIYLLQGSQSRQTLQSLFCSRQTLQIQSIYCLQGSQSIILVTTMQTNCQTLHQ